MKWLNSGTINETSSYQVPTTVFDINDFVSISGNTYIGTLNQNNILKQIDNGLIHKKTCGRSEIILFETSGIGTIPSVHYTTRYDIWNTGVVRFVPNHGAGNYVHIPDFSYLVNSGGNSLTITHIPPQSLRQYRSEYIYPDYDKLNSINNGSIQSFNYSGEKVNSYITNYNTLSLDNNDNQIYYGGVFNSNLINIYNFQVKENIVNHTIWSTYEDHTSGTISSCTDSPYNGAFDNAWSGIYGNALLVPIGYSYNQRFYAGNLSMPNSSTFSIFKDCLIYFNAAIDNNISEGNVIIDYTCYKEPHSCYVDFYPQGFKIVPTGLINNSFNSYGTQIIDTLTIGGSLGVYNYRVGFFPRTISTIDIPGSSVLFSSGQLSLSTSDTLDDVVNKFSGITPYGVKCYGNPISNMFIIAKGYIESGHLSSGLSFDSFAYDATILNLNIKYNKINNRGGTTGEINDSGNVIWHHNHGQDLIKYNEVIVGSSILYPSGHTENGIYEPPNHYGEIYRVQYDKSTKSLYTTGNLVKKSVFSPAIYYLMPSSIVNFAPSSTLMTSGDYFASFGTICGTGTHCIVPTSIFTGLLTVYVPTGFMVSNFDSQCTSGLCSGLIEYRVDKKSLQYFQNQTSDLTCGNEIEIPSYLVKYTGEFPNIEVGNMPLFINLEE